MTWGDQWQYPHSMWHYIPSPQEHLLQWWNQPRCVRDVFWYAFEPVRRIKKDHIFENIWSGTKFYINRKQFCNLKYLNFVLLLKERIGCKAELEIDLKIWLEYIHSEWLFYYNNLTISGILNMVHTDAARGIG